MGICGCEVSNAAVSAMVVMPGVAARKGNGGASVLGDNTFRYDMAGRANCLRDLAAMPDVVGILSETRGGNKKWRRERDKDEVRRSTESRPRKLLEIAKIRRDGRNLWPG